VNAVDVIRTKRDGGRLSDEQIRWFELPGPAPMANVVAAIEQWSRSWAEGGPVRSFGVFDDDRGELVAALDVELLEDVAHVGLDRLLADHERLGDLAVGHAVRGHAGDADRADQAAVVEQVRLRDVRHAVANHGPEAGVAELLLAEGDGNRESLRDALRVVEVVERAGLLKVNRVDLLQHAAHRNGVLGIVRAVGVRMDGDPIAQHFARQRNELFRAAG